MDLDQVQRQLAEAVRTCSSAMPAAASGWTVFDAIGVTGLLAPESGARSALGLLEWCLVMEELGSGCRDLDLIRSVRVFLDVYAGRKVGACDAFESWVREVRSHRDEKALVTSRVAGGGSVLWSTAACSPELSGLPDVLLEPHEAEAVRDRDLLTCAAYALGIGRRCLEMAQERAGERMIAGQLLIEYQAVSHRLAESAISLAGARICLRRAAFGENQGIPAGYRASAAIAASVTASMTCAQEAVQTFGAAGTSDPELVSLYYAAYKMAGICGPPRELWQLAGARWMASGFPGAVPIP